MTSQLDYSPADVLRWLLVSLSAGTDPADDAAWPAYVSNEPDSPDNLLVMYDTAGIPVGFVQSTGEMMEYRGVSVQVRGTSHAVAWAKVDAVRRLLDESVHNAIVTIGSTQYAVHSVVRKSGPIALGREPSTSRYLFTLNVVVSLRQLE